MIISVHSYISIYKWENSTAFIVSRKCCLQQNVLNSSPVKQRGTVLGNRVGSQELIQLGERVRQKRKDCHLSQETLAEKVGISVNTVSRIEGGQAAISIEIFVKLVEVLGADANELLGKNPEGDRNPATRMVSRVLNLQPKSRKLNPDHKRLMDGIEGIR